jgi:hypothetical protein
MLRRTLSIYLAFVLVAGPDLCCCSAMRLVNRLAQGKNAAAKVAANHEQTCCHCSAPVEEKQQEKSAVPAPSPEKKRCPCQHEAPILAAAPLTDTFGAGSSRALAPGWAQVITVTSPAIPILDVPSPSGMPSFPFLISLDLLHVHHLLLC